MATVTLITETNTAVPAAGSVNIAVPANKRFLSAYLLRLAPGNSPLEIAGIHIAGAVVTVYFDIVATVSEYEVVAVFGEDIDTTQPTATLIDNGNGTLTYDNGVDPPVVYNSKQVLSISGQIVTLSPGNSDTLPQDTDVIALTERLNKLENCFAKFCKSCPPRG